MTTEQISMFRGLGSSSRGNTTVSGINSLINRNMSLLTHISDIIGGPTPKSFAETVLKGDILISKRGIGGLVGHAAIMINDYTVLEMPGGEGWQYGIEDNNRCISKYDWYNLHKSDWTTVYRNKDSYVARLAAEWAERNYYNRFGGQEKTEHITYKLTHDIFSKNPSYCSKLVLHAYYFGTGDRNVIRDLTIIDMFIVPSTIPSYFLSPYTLDTVGRF